MNLDKLDGKWMIAGQNRQQDRVRREKGFSGNLLLSVTLVEGIMLGTIVQLFFFLGHTQVMYFSA